MIGVGVLGAEPSDTPAGASRIATFCNSVVSELQNHVTGLDTTTVPAARVHQLVPWNPEELQALAGERHLAVWPTESVETPEPISNVDHELHQGFVALVWEDASAETSRAASDVTATTAFLDLFEAVRARFYVDANQFLDGSELLWYAGATFPGAIGAVRWFAIHLDRRIEALMR